MTNILITGSSNGIGESIAALLAGSGHSVFLTGRDETKLACLQSHIGAKGYFAIDLLRENAADILYNKAKEALGGIEVLINNAGGYFYGKVEDTSISDINRLVRLNTIVPYELISLCVKDMKSASFGRIINIGSISGVVGEANASLYSMTKSAFTGMTKALALELAAFNITVNTISPGFVKTRLLEESFDECFTKEELTDMIPQSRFIEPVEIANLVRYLISQEAKGVTGQNINLCAGMSVG
ncbi:MAG: SDR family NAD(P)-dependent oxidoreductase [Candidatus Gastranaerophilales bacterium]|nr:SDR family NAD(P)-dependent oxidoreductase [Candidatus Gastranaerophilales bacterium]